jgi:hypothetical protein
MSFSVHDDAKVIIEIAAMLEMALKDFDARSRCKTIGTS